MPALVAVSCPSARQVMIVNLAGLGLSYAQIGARLFLAESTVKTDVRALRESWDVRCRAGLVGWCLALGLIEAPQLWRPPLSRKRSLVLRLLAFGANYATAAMVLGVARSTVNTHVSGALDTLGAVNSAHGVLLAAGAGRISLADSGLVAA